MSETKKGEAKKAGGREEKTPGGSGSSAALASKPGPRTRPDRSWEPGLLFGKDQGLSRQAAIERDETPMLAAYRHGLDLGIFAITGPALWREATPSLLFHFEGAFFHRLWVSNYPGLDYHVHALQSLSEKSPLRCTRTRMRGV